MLPVLLILFFLVSLSGTFIVRKTVTKTNILDIPNIRSSHNQPTPRGGGLAIAIAWYITIFILLLLKEIPDYLFVALLCGVPITIISLIDDIVTISPKFRLVVQFLCSSLAVFLLGGINSIDLGFATLHSSFLFSIAAVVGIVWFTNLFNFLDGIDGYISVEIIFICLAAFILLGLELPLFLAAATAGFLLWNWQSAKIFMGDVGSTLLGFTIGVFVIYYQNSNQSSIVIWLMLTSLFWFDATFTLFRRWRNHEQLFKAHRKHAFQRIVQSGFSHQKTVIFSILINIPIIGLVWLALEFPDYLLPVFGINIAYLYVVMKMVDKRFPFKKA
ncbi:MAG: glycosyltransferase family 4 protein [Bacteroidales bacterium]|nr:glycosyltransferase family 4 protein [Bacteroidales bacterium]